MRDVKFEVVGWEVRIGSKRSWVDLRSLDGLRMIVPRAVDVLMERASDTSDCRRI